ncbi:MAG: site-specific DNA-methyltransferase [Candidatus Saccharimonadales bacterium]
MPSIQFKGKTFVQNHHLAVPYHQLIPKKDKSLTESVSLHDNLVIQGDNLLALKALLPTYAGKIKCIYIDPPYNTGNEGWAYNDNVNSPLIKEWLKDKTPVDKEDLTRHDKWLCMMLPRLKLLRELLADDGVILVSIDDIEQARLKLLMDEVFQEHNFISTLVWKSRQNKDNRSLTGVSNDHEYVLAYARDIYVSKLFIGDERKVEQYSNPDNDPRGDWVSGNMVGILPESQRPNCHYELVNPDTGVNYGKPKLGWRYDKNTMSRLINEERILWPKEPTGRPRRKVFLSEMKDSTTGFSSVVGKDIYTRHGSADIDEIFGERKFDFPKPVAFVKSLLQQVTNEDSIVLDSFSGTGTTAQAVLELNKDDGGNRKFVLVEMEDYTDEITAERVRRVIKGIPKSKNENLKQGLGGTFSYFKLGDPIETEGILDGSKLPSYLELARYVYYTATGEEFNESKLNEGTGFIGSSKHHDVYMIYKPDIEYLKQTALTLNKARELRKKAGSRPLLVFAPTKYVESGELDELKIDFCQLPFEIYKVGK